MVENHSRPSPSPPNRCRQPRITLAIEAIRRGASRVYTYIDTNLNYNG